MSKVIRGLVMREGLVEAQARFVQDIGPELHRIGGFSLVAEKSGEVVFSDGVVDPMVFRRDGLRYALLRRMMAHRIPVAFTQDADGTKVAIRGSAPRDIRNALDRLGRPRHWPEINTAIE